MKFKNKGFTLIELLVVIVIIGVLMAYAVPSYQRNVIVSKRTQAHNALMQIAAVQERSNATFQQYASGFAGVTADADNLGLASMAFNTSPDYTYTMDNTNGYTITATATGNTQINDNFGVNCTVLTLNSLGQRTPLACWQ